METRRRFAKQALAGGAAALAGHGISRLPWAQGNARTGVLTPGAVGASAAITGAGSLKAHAAAKGLFVGTAVNVGLLERDAVYRRTIAEQCSIVVAENAMKWGALRPGPESFDFGEADRFVAFAEAHGMAIRGHNLCWHEALPGWFGATVNRGNAEGYLSRHIAAVAGRYRGRIRAWDVVNEAIELKDGQPGGMRNSPWYKLLGPGYVDVAFRAARAADPAALLTYNDYSIETDGGGDTAKRAAVLALLTRMKRDGVPVDAVGVQSHLSADSAGQVGKGLMEFVRRVAEMGLKVFVTELDVNDDALGSDNPGVRGEEVGAIYGSYVGRLLGDAAVTDVLTWGVANGASWLNAPGGGAKFRPKHLDREEICLPFDDAYGANPAFYALRGALEARKSVLRRS